MSKEQNLQDKDKALHIGSVMPSFDSPLNWKEDFKHENGNYTCKCYQCDRYFIGHKRRPMCKECSDKYDAS